MSKQTSINLTDATQGQVKALTVAGFGTFTQVVRTAIDRLHTTEIPAVQFVLETISSAFGISDDIPWYRAHRETFATLREAQSALDRDQTEMNERCGPGCAWDSHRRIVPTRDTTATFHLVCTGSMASMAPGGHRGCPDMKQTTITIPWPAGEPCPQPEAPEGWHETFQCNICAEYEDQAREKMYEEIA